MWSPTGWFCNSPETGWGGPAPGKSSNGIEKVYGTYALEVESMTPGEQWNVDSKKRKRREGSMKIWAWGIGDDGKINRIR